MSVQEIKEQALKLSADEREWLAEELMASLDEPDDAEFQAELDRRLEELRSGKVKGIPFDEAIARSREALKKIREEKGTTSGSR